jgi:hypothetical protein
MARQWKFELTTPAGMLDHYMHDDGSWEWDPATPNMQPDEIRDLVHRLAEARRQFERLGWTRAELSHLP